MIDSGSLEWCECQKRVDGLYRESHIWLVREAKKLTKHTEEAEALVSDLYLYLIEKCNPKIFYSTNTYNLFYCNKFLYSRWMNKVKILNRTTLVENPKEDVIEMPYDWECDERIQRTHEQVMGELKALERTRMWPASKIFQLYFDSDDTMEEISQKIGISKSTTFLAIKKIRSYLKEVINNPFNEKT
jgi:SpoVK/Ycf46/Vps4 family AAA+-type ATPase